MTLSMVTVIGQIRALVAQVTGMERVYAASETDANGIPAALNEFPCAMVLPGPTTEFITLTGRHNYEVKVQVFEAGADMTGRTATVLPFVDLLIAKFVANVTLGGRANSCVFARDSGMVGLEYGGKTYTGYEITLVVSEQSPVTPAAGS